MNEQMRKEFEEWFYNDLSDAAGLYHLAWQAWQASRESIVVDLSDLCEASYTFSGTCYKSDVEYRLEQSGVSYK
jgi:hypothetical protein